MAASTADVVRLRDGQRVAAIVFAVGWFFAAGGTLALLAWMGLWVLVGLAGVVVIAVEVVAVRASRIRLEFASEGLVVANLIRTHRIRRNDVGQVDVGRWDSPFGELLTLFVQGGAAEPVRVEAVAVGDGHDAELDHWLDRVDAWRFRRR